MRFHLPTSRGARGPRPSGARRGFAIAFALVAIVVIGGLVSGIYYESAQQYRISRTELVQTRAIAMSEYGINKLNTQTEWNTRQTAYNNLVVGQTDSTSAVFVMGTDTAKVRVTRLAGGTFPIWLLVSEGRSGTATIFQARHRTSLLVSTNRPVIKFLGALTTHGSTKIGGSSLIDGHDNAGYSGWNCPPAPASNDKPGIAIDDTTQIQTSGCNNYNCVSGSSKLQQTAAAADTMTYFNYGNGMDWNTLVSWAVSAGKVVSGGPNTPSILNGQCNTADVNNWGDPNRNLITPGKCETYYPIIYSPGDLHVTGGKGQGILIVNGDLKVDGGFEFYGPVIVRKDLDTQGTGGHFNGGVMAANVSLNQNVILGNAVINYSSCITNQVLNAISPPTSLPLRAWAEVF